MRGHTVEAVAGNGEDSVVGHEQLVNFGQLGSGAKVRVGASPFERDDGDALIFGSNIELRRRGQQSGGENAWCEDAGEASGREDRDAGSGADVGSVAGNCERLDLVIGQALGLGEGVSLAGVKVEDAAVERANPEIGFVAGEGGDVEGVESGMEDGDLFAVVDKNAARFCAEEKMSGTDGLNSSDRAGFGSRRENLAEGTSIEGEEAVVGGGDDQFWLMRVGENCRGDGDQR